MIEHIKKLPRIPAIWTTCVLVLVICYGAFLRPQQKILKTLKAENTNKAKEFEILQTLQLPREQKNLTDQLNAREQQYQNLVFSPTDLSSLDFHIREMVSQRDLQDFTCKNIFSREDKSFKTYIHIGQQKLNIHAMCGFAGFIRFLNDLERHQPAAFVTEFRLTRDYVRSENDLAAASLDVCVFYEKDKN